MNENFFKRYIDAGCEVKRNVLAKSAFGKGTKLSCVVYPHDLMQTMRAIEICEDSIIIGRATNVVFCDGDFDKTLICTDLANKITLEGNGLYCMAGAGIASVCKECCRIGLSGIEPLSGIPGSIGGAIAMNAGAYGREICELVSYADVIKDGELMRLSNAQMRFGYRDSLALQEKIYIVGAMLDFAKADCEQVKQSIRGYRQRRLISQPSQKSLGSVFKRVDGISAGYYIDKAGLKGEREGGAQVSQKHAGFIVDTGGASYSDFITLAERVREIVKEFFGIKLEYEVRFLR